VATDGVAELPSQRIGGALELGPDALLLAPADVDVQPDGER